MQVFQFALPFRRPVSSVHFVAPRMAVGAFWSLFIGMLPICLTGCGSEEIAAGRAGGRPPALVRIGRIEQRDVIPRVTVVGSVVPVRTSVVASGANGLVETFHIEEGDYVRANEPLSELRIKTTDLAIAEAQAVLDERQRELDEMEAGSRREDLDEGLAKMKAAEAVMRNMAKKMARSKSLLARGAINQDEYDDALQYDEGSQQSFRAAKATYDKLVAGPRKEAVDQARARREAQQNQVKFLEADKLKRITRAPFDGFVVKEHTYRGQWLSKGDPVVTLARMDEVDVIANVDQQDESLVRLFDDAQIRINGIPQRDWTGRIKAVVPRSEWRSGSRGFPVKVRLRNSRITVKGVDEDGNEYTRILPVLKEGMMAQVTFSGAPLQALLAPKNALVRTSRGTQIFLFKPLLVPKWSVRSGEEVLGNVVAADEEAAKEKAQTQFAVDSDAALSVEKTTQPHWEIRRTVAADEKPELFGYLEADSEELAAKAARKTFKLSADIPISVLPQLGSVRRIVVELGISDGEMVQILSEEATPGSFVVTEGAERLQDYQDVQLPREKPSQPTTPDKSSGKKPKQPH
ncbi:MAG: HlyD family efflux transporter periplasmic adaptor subunit [Planctomycetaceae bacterium]|nr:HlyD family efflux transporter periplasmic adaptor subunit [Planctomycetaceae bacterium]MBT6485623.1 HlyD family efflux transporter periplasmic adaptor subunit [Planctomycetaceae bacterium]